MEPNFVNQPVLQTPQIPQSSIFRLVIAVLLSFMLGAVTMYLWQNPQALNSLPFAPQPKGCTMEAKICPDGSSVGRVPPDCEFAPCPSLTPSITPPVLPSPSVLLPTISPSPQSLVPAGWKTYKNEKYAFEFKYPKEWSVQSPKNPNDTALIYIYSDKTYGNGPEPLIYYLWIQPEKELPNLNLKTETINGKQIKYTEETLSRLGGIAYYFENKKEYISINLTPYNSTQPFEGQKEHKIIFDQILSTFRFSE